MLKNKIKSIINDVNIACSDKKIACYLGGWLGYRNLGDEALFEVYKQFFSNKFVFTNKTYINKLAKFMRRQYNFNVVVLAGGTLINRGANLLRQLQNMKCDNKVVFGTGVANPNFWSKEVNGYNDLKNWVKELNTFKYVGVRGPISKAILDDAGVTGVRVVGDPVLQFADTTISYKDKHSKVIGVNIGVSNGKVWGLDEQIVFDNIEKILRALIKAGWKVKFFPVWIDDVECTKNMMDRLNIPLCCMHSYFYDYKSFKKQVRKCSVFIGEKLHASILSICTYTPTIMIEYRPKCKDFMESINLDKKFNIRCDCIDVESTIDIINQIYFNIHNVQDEIYNKVQIMLKVQNKEKSSLLSILNIP